MQESVGLLRAMVHRQSGFDKIFTHLGEFETYMLSHRSGIQCHQISGLQIFLNQMDIGRNLSDNGYITLLVITSPLVAVKVIRYPI